MIGFIFFYQILIYIFNVIVSQFLLLICASRRVGKDQNQLSFKCLSFQNGYNITEHNYFKFLILLRNFTHRPKVIIRLLSQKKSNISSVVLCGPFFYFRYIAQFSAGSFFCLTSLLIEWCQQFSFLDVHPSGKWQSAICSPNLEAKVISLAHIELF